jgi:hypothetical protein
MFFGGRKMKKIIFVLFSCGIMECASSPNQKSSQPVSTPNVSPTYSNKTEWELAEAGFDARLENAMNATMSIMEDMEAGRIGQSEGKKQINGKLNDSRKTLDEWLEWINYGYSKKYIDATKYQESTALHQVKMYAVDMLEQQF